MSDGAAGRHRQAGQRGLQPAAFLDRDGVINVDTGYTVLPDDLIFTPTAVAAIKLLNASDYLAIVVTNQSGVARGLYGMAEVEAFHDHIQAELSKRNAWIDAFYYCPYHPDGIVEGFAQPHDDRKPAPGMLMRAMRERSIDPARSFIVGDRESDKIAGERAGIRATIIPSNIGDLEAAVRAMLGVAEMRSLLAP